jgi:hypothetical protein
LKGQFATIEALSSLFIVMSVMCLSSQMINNSQQSLVLERGSISAKAAAYDLLMQILRNQTTRECATDTLNSTCMNGYSGYYKMIYGIDKIGVIQNQQEGNNYSNIYCESVSNSIVCVGVS